MVKKKENWLKYPAITSKALYIIYLLKFFTITVLAVRTVENIAIKKIFLIKTSYNNPVIAFILSNTNINLLGYVALQKLACRH